MPSKKPIIAVRTTEKIIEKFNIICRAENRSMSKQAEKMILDLIADYEAAHGTIQIASTDDTDDTKA